MSRTKRPVVPHPSDDEAMSQFWDALLARLAAYIETLRRPGQPAAEMAPTNESLNPTMSKRTRPADNV